MRRIIDSPSSSGIPMSASTRHDLLQRIGIRVGDRSFLHVEAQLVRHGGEKLVLQA
jgi:hypothetical protein